MDPLVKTTLSFQLELTPTSEGFHPSCPRATVLTWKGPKEHHEFTDPPKFDLIVPNALCRILRETIKAGTLPLSFKVHSAFVTTDHDQELVAYDVQGSEGLPLVPAFYGARSLEDSLANQLRRTGATVPKEQLPRWIDRAGRVTHEIEIAEYTASGSTHTFRLKDTIRFFRYPLGEYACALPIPRFQDVGKLSEHAFTVGYREDDGRVRLADKLWNALNALTGVLWKPGKQIVLLQGSPGNGKELFSRAIHFGSIRRNYDAFATMSVAGLSLTSLRRSLFGSVGPRGELIDGQVEKAAGGSLFLDEFDKAATDSDQASFYTTLLRALESGTYIPEDGLAQRKIEDVSWIMAGAFSEGFGAVPKDLWSRITHRLTVPEVAREEGCARSLFLLFHFQNVLRRWRLSEQELLTANTLAAEHGRRLLVEDGRSRDDALTPPDGLLALAQRFEQEVIATQGEIGVRSIRQAALAASDELHSATTRPDPMTPTTLGSVFCDEGRTAAIRAAIATLELNRPPAQPNP